MSAPLGYDHDALREYVERQSDGYFTLAEPQDRRSETDRRQGERRTRAQRDIAGDEPTDPAVIARIARACLGHHTDA